MAAEMEIVALLDRTAFLPVRSLDPNTRGIRSILQAQYSVRGFHVLPSFSNNILANILSSYNIVVIY
jgi:hypothetical protein